MVLLQCGAKACPPLAATGMLKMCENCSMGRNIRCFCEDKALTYKTSGNCFVKRKIHIYTFPLTVLGCSAIPCQAKPNQTRLVEKQQYAFLGERYQVMKKGSVSRPDDVLKLKKLKKVDIIKTQLKC